MPYKEGNGPVARVTVQDLEQAASAACASLSITNDAGWNTMIDARFNVANVNACTTVAQLVAEVAKQTLVLNRLLKKLIGVTPTAD